MAETVKLVWLHELDKVVANPKHPLIPGFKQYEDHLGLFPAHERAKFAAVDVVLWENGRGVKIVITYKDGTTVSLTHVGGFTIFQ